MMIEQQTKEFEGKTISEIESDYGTFYMAEHITFKFTDGSELNLTTDRRGEDCYISQYEND